MAHSLSLNGGAIQIPKITFTGDFSVTLVATQQANGRFFCGGDNTAGSIEIYRNNSGIVALYIGTVGQFSGTTVLSTLVDSPDTIVIARAGTSVTVLVNGILQGTVTFSGSMHISWFGLRQGWGNYPATMRFYSCNMQDLANSANSRNYDASLSNGTGVLLPTTAGTNAGTQFGSFPTDDSEWVFFESGSANSALILSQLPKLTGSTNLQSQAPSNFIAANGALPKITAAISLSRAEPVNQIGISCTLPLLTKSISISSAQPNISMHGNCYAPRLVASIQLMSPVTYPQADADSFTVQAIADGSFSFESRISPTVGFNAMISSTFKYNGSLN